jgi:tRNA threonylcarbamoyl adenosine modification protein YeaZ
VILLALESATAVCSVAVCDDGGRVLGHRRGAGASDQADRLVELIDTVLRGAGLDYPAVDVIAVNHGPGSFTGIRAGVAAARALGLAAARPVIAVNTLEVLAAALGPQRSGTIVAALDARRGQVYAQRFDHRLGALGAPQALAPEDVTLAGAAPPLRLVGTGAALLRAALPEDLAASVEPAEPDALYVAHRALARLAAGERPAAGPTVQPLYLRAPDARLPAAPGARHRVTVGA